MTQSSSCGAVGSASARRLMLKASLCPMHVQVLEKKLADSGMPLEPYTGYLDMRRYGTVPHSGFGLGFERLILFATGLDNIREAIPFPRWPGHADS